MTTRESSILETVLTELKSIRTGMPNGELKQILESQKDMKEDISDLKYTLLNPEDGVIVKVNKNTAFRRSFEKVSDQNQQIFGAIVTILTKVFFYSTTGNIL